MNFDYLVEVESEALVAQLSPDFTGLKNIAVRGAIVTARSSDPRFDFVSRFSAPAVGINEDPVTGSAHCCLGDFWHKRLRKNDLRAFQASARGGAMRVRVEGERVFLGGKAVTVAGGELEKDEQRFWWVDARCAAGRLPRITENLASAGRSRTTSPSDRQDA